MRIVLGYDGSEAAQHALADLQLAGLPPVVDALVVVAWTPARRFAAYRSDASTGDPHSQQQARELAVEAASRLARHFPGWACAPAALQGNPATVLLEAADRHDAALTVIGAHGRSPIRRAALGSVTKRVLQHAQRTVRIARDGPRSAGPPRLVIGIDGSPNAEHVVATVATRSWPPGASAICLAAADVRMLDNVPVFMEKSLTSAAMIADRLAQLAAQRLSEAGVGARAVCSENSASAALLAEAERSGADCIYVGRRGLTRAERIMLGSVSTTVALRARCSVEVVHMPPA